MRSRLVAVLLAATLASGLLAGSAAATTAELELEAAVDDDDSQRSSYVFEVAGDGAVDVEITTPPTQTDGDVTHEFVGWEAVDGGDSGTGTSWTAQAGEQYRVVYESTASDGASPGQYSFDFEARGGGATYRTTFDVDVEVLSPEFGGLDAGTAEVVVGPGAGSGADAVEVAIPNDGDGVMVPTALRFRNEPAGIEASTASLPDRIEAGETGTATVEITADESVSAGTHELTVVAEDSLGNEAGAAVGVEVYKPPAVEADPATLDVGEVAVGETGSAQVEIEELTGRADVDALGVDVESDAGSGGSISTSELEGLGVPAGGSATAEVSVSVGEAAARSDELEWDLELTPAAEKAPATELEVTADVISPPYFGTLTASGTEIRFDRPRSDAETFTRTVRIDVPNDGDRTMTIVDADASIDGSGVDAEVTSAPDAIDGRSSETVSVEVVADAEASAGDRSLTVAVESVEDGTERIVTDVDLVKYPGMRVTPESVDFGETAIGVPQSRRVTVRERLEYRDVEEFEITRVDGPEEGWLELRSPPTSLEAGERARMGLALEFDADAELFTPYEWTFRIDGANVETRTVVVRATPRPVECTEVVEELESYEGRNADAERFAARVAEAIRTVEEDARDGQADAIADVASACTAGRGAVLFLNANEAALETDDLDGRQEHVARMSFGLGTVERYGTEIGNAEARAAARQGTDLGDEILRTRIDAQEAAVESTLENATALQEARAKTQLARLSGLRGDDDEAAAVRAEADGAFEEYLSLVSEGNAALREARNRRDGMNEELFVSVGGQPLFWIADYDEFQSNRAAVLDRYDSAVDAFEGAGAEERADAAAAERSDVASAYRSALIFSGILAGLSGLAFLLVVLYEARAVYRYIRDVETVRTGSFLI